jgi:hypothetical protein
MPIDNFKPRGPSKNTKIDSGGADAKNYPIIGIVKDNIDPTRAGRIRVALQDGKASVNPDDASNWVTVQYLTSFFGSVQPTAGSDSEDLGTYKGNPSSYGQWQAPPDLGTKVICIFVNGDVNAGYYIGAIPDPETLHMVPAIGAAEEVKLNENEAQSFGGATRLPATNINTNNRNIADSDDFLEETRPVHSYTAGIMSQQGIIRDPVRGPISSSASRETVSRVGWGVSTPGRPIYEGGYDDENLPDNLDQSNAEKLKIVARRGGHSIVMDDGDIIGRDQLVRIRTALGHQILMSDDGQTLMILHSNGQSYIELGKEGTVDIYSTNSINMRTEGDLNLHADRDINLNARENFNIKGKNLNVNTEEEATFKTGQDFKLDIGSNFTVKAKSAIALNASGQASLVSSSETFINGSKVNLNSGNASLKAGSVTDITKVAHSDTLFDQTTGWSAAPGKLLSITSRAPAHYPWVGAGLGVDIDNSPSAEDNLPAPASEAVENINEESITANTTVTNEATSATVPDTPASSSSFGKNIMNSLLGAAATIAAALGARALLRSGSGVTNNNPTASYGVNSALEAANQNVTSSGELQPLNPEVAVGVYTRSPKALVKTGILKPGSDTLVNALAGSGAVPSDIIPESLYTGVSGAENTLALSKNLEAQTQSVINNMKIAQQQLTEVGLITGRESPNQIGGILTASAILGTNEVVELANKKVINDNDNLNTSNNLMLSLISTTNLSVRQDESNGIFSGLSNTVDILSDSGETINNTLGAENASYNLIKNSFPTLEANVPVNLSASVKQKMTDSKVLENTLLPQLSVTGITAVDNNSIESIVGRPVTDTVAGTVNTISTATLTNINATFDTSLNAISSVSSGALGTVSTSVSGVVDQVNSLSGASTSLTDGITGLSNSAKSLQAGDISSRASFIASGISGIPGSVNNIGAIGNNIGTSITSQANQLSSINVSGAKSGITNSLKSLLPIGAVAGLLSSVGSIGKAGSSPIKLPSFGVNTRDRTAQTAQFKNVLNDPAIPSANFTGGVSDRAIEVLNRAKKRLRRNRETPPTSEE